MKSGGIPVLRAAGTVQVGTYDSFPVMRKRRVNYISFVTRSRICIIHRLPSKGLHKAKIREQHMRPRNTRKWMLSYNFSTRLTSDAS